ncbi:MAG: signal recognition particle-docking protein FtsY [bacterium]|nr:signal recognition particle-docking protein FtsY [bacterium]
MNLLRRLSQAVSRTREEIGGRLRELLGTGRRVDGEMLADLEEILLGADLGPDTAERVVAGLRERIRTDADTPLDQLIEQELLALLKPAEGADDAGGNARPRVVLVVGVNGSGKTTTTAKLAAQAVGQGRRVLLVAADTFRAAAVEQLEVWAGRAGADLIKAAPGADPAAVAFDGLSAALARGHDLVLVDTAGRLHNKKNLMTELDKIRRVLGRRLPGAPHEVLLVLDGTTGQNALSQARLFTEATGVTGLVLTKLDGTARGGIALAIHQELGIPVRWIGVGEGLADLQPFDPALYARALFEGLGALAEEGR